MLGLEREAFYNLCFITENDVAPRTLVVDKLTTLLENGYTRESLAYNFCVGVFSQEGMQSITVRAKRKNESYQQAFAADNNDSYYFVCIESKDPVVVKSFYSYIANEPYKLLFYSSPNNSLTNTKAVHYYQTAVPPSDVFNVKQVSNNHLYVNNAYKLGYDARGISRYANNSEFADKRYKVFLGVPELTTAMLQRFRLAYPEAAWIALCGNRFPSNVQWLYKYLAKTDIVFEKSIPDLSNTSSIVLKDKAVVGSGKTNQNILIHEQVSVDWVKWAISRKVWQTLYTQNKVNATQGGVDLIINDIKMVLDLAVEQSIFTKYKIGESKLDRNTNNLQVSFTANLTNTILEVEVNGSLKY